MKIMHSILLSFVAYSMALIPNSVFKGIGSYSHRMVA